MEHVTSRLRRFSVSAFTSTMGVAGLALVAQRSVRLWDFPFWIGHVLLVVAVGVFSLFTALYFVKALRYQDLVAAELKNPQTLFVFPAFSVTLLLLAVAFLDVHSETSRTLWVGGVVVQSILILLVVIRPPAFDIQHLNPSWFIPVVGNVLIPIAGVRHYSPEISWFFFSVGIVFWLVLLTLMLHRMIFDGALPQRFVPMLGILIAPPAAAVLGYINLVGGLDSFARLLYYTALFTTLIVLLQYRFLSGRRFTPSWWALSFPAAAVTLATMRIYELSHWSFLKGLAAVLCTLLVAIVTALAILTLRAAVRDEILVSEP